jgi:hypothetical protein
MSDAAAKRRARQTVRNLLLSLLVSFAMVAIIVIAVPRDESNRIPKVDYAKIAAQVEDSTDYDVVAPELPEGWWVSNAKWTPANNGAVANWTLSFIGPNNQFVGMTQAWDINATWLFTQLGEGAAPNVQQFGADWWQYTVPEPKDPPKMRDIVRVYKSNLETATGDTVLLYGFDSEADFELISSLVTKELSGD